MVKMKLFSLILIMSGLTSSLKSISNNLNQNPWNVKKLWCREKEKAVIQSCPGLNNCSKCCPFGLKTNADGCLICKCEMSGIFGDDMIITESNYHQFFRPYNLDNISFSRNKRAANKGHYNLWPKERGSKVVKIPYKINGEVSQIIKSTLKEVVSTLTKLTCVRFIPHKRQLDYIEVLTEEDNFCASSVGKLGGFQKLYLGNQCQSRAVIAHEVMHALGFDHEQSRPDRKDYVKIFWKNIKPDKKFNFAMKDKRFWDPYQSSYDTNSVMHYTSYQSSQNNKSTILKINGDVIYNKSNFSVIDLLQINRMYKCPDHYEKLLLMKKNQTFCNNKLKNKKCDFYANQNWCSIPKKKSFMKTNCKESCKFCSLAFTVNDDTKISTTTIAPRKESSTCYDKLSLCKSWARNNYCTNGRFKTVARINCKFSCKACKVDRILTTTSSTTTTHLSIVKTEKCLDKKRNCESLSRKGYCNFQKYFNFMKTNCKKTCLLCGGFNKIEVKTSTSTVTTTKAPQRCRNHKSKCSIWSQRGYCENPKFRTYMKTTCKLSCGYCNQSIKSDVSTSTTTTNYLTKTAATTRVTSTISPTLIGKNNSCKDTKRSCKLYEKMSFCNSSTSRSYMQRYCKKTCSYCT